MMLDASAFREIWAADFEFAARSGERPMPICLVAQELRSGRTIRLWRDDFGDRPPYSIGPDSLFVSYYASAELGCHIANGWAMPAHVLDLCAEFKNFTSGYKGLHADTTITRRRNLLGALLYYGLPHIGKDEKKEMQDLAIRRGPWTTQERADLLAYCETDVDSLSDLLPAMLPRIDLGRALIRGQYMIACAHMEWNGIPVDTETLNRLRPRWEAIQSRLIANTPVARELYDGRTFKELRFVEWLAVKGIPWPFYDSGQIILEDDTFAEMADIYPIIRPIYEFRHSMAKLRLSDLAVGSDGRNRTILSAFGSKTGRNQPSNSKFIYGPAKWMRGLILLAAIASGHWTLSIMARTAPTQYITKRVDRKRFGSSQFHLDPQKTAHGPPSLFSQMLTALAEKPPASAGYAAAI